MKRLVPLIVLLLIAIISCTHGAAADTETTLPENMDIALADVNVTVNPTISPLITADMAQAQDEAFETAANAELEQIMGFDTEIAPRFEEPDVALDDIKSAVFGSRGWTIHFASEDFVYAGYSEYSPYIIRYNVKDNTIDRALDVSGLGRYFPFVSARLSFTADGRHMIYHNMIFSPGSNIDLASKEFPSPVYCVYEVDFDAGLVALLSETYEDWGMPEGYGPFNSYDSAYTLRPTKGGRAFHKGTEIIRLSSLDGYSIAEHMPIGVDDKLFALLLHPVGSSNLELGYFLFAVVDVEKDILIGLCPINVR